MTRHIASAIPALHTQNPIIDPLTNETNIIDDTDIIIMSHPKEQEGEKLEEIKNNNNIHSIPSNSAQHDASFLDCFLKGPKISRPATRLGKRKSRGKKKKKKRFKKVVYRQGPKIRYWQQENEQPLPSNKRQKMMTRSSAATTTTTTAAAGAITTSTSHTKKTKAVWTSPPPLPPYSEEFDCFQSHIFIPGSVPNFWECSYCNGKPLHNRPKYSVIFYGDSKTPPSPSKNKFIREHCRLCHEIQALRYSFAPPPPVATATAATSTNANDHDPSPMTACQTTTSYDALFSGSGETFDNKENYCLRLENSDDNAKGIQKLNDNFKSNNNNNTLTTAEVDATTTNGTLRFKIGPIMMSSPNNGLVFPKEDKYLTSSLDVLIMCHVVPCQYICKIDNPGRQKKDLFMEGFPGLECLHCRPKEGRIIGGGGALDDDRLARRKRTFFCQDAKALARAFSRIENHLLSCDSVPNNVKNDIWVTREIQEEERTALRRNSGLNDGEGRSYFTRKDFSEVVMDRLGI